MLIDTMHKENCRFENIEAPPEIKQIIRDYDPQPKKFAKTELKIVLTDEEPINQRPRRLPVQEAKEVNQEVQRLLDEGVIVPSASEYASPIVPVRRKDGSLRLCVDYRRINRKTIKDRFPLPVIEDQLDKLRDATIFSLVDLRNGFHHITVHPNSRKYTAFITQEAQYEYVKMPFGLSNGPAVFQRFICEIFKELVRLGII